MTSTATPGTPLLQMRGITKTFPGVVANDSVDFDVRRGEVIEFNPDFDLSDDVRSAADELISELSSGAVQTGVSGEAPSGSAPAGSEAA